MAEPLTDMEEIAGPGADIENALAPAPIELEFLHPSEIDSHPPIEVQILSPTAARIIDGVAIVDRLEAHRVDARDDLFDIEPKNKAPGQDHSAEVALHAAEEVRISELSELVGEAHRNEKLYP